MVESKIKLALALHYEHSAPYCEHLEHPKCFDEHNEQNPSSKKNPSLHRHFFV